MTGMMLSGVVDGMMLWAEGGTIDNERVVAADNFFSVGTINISGLLKVNNRATIIGTYTQAPGGGIQARNVEIFPDARTLLQKVGLYIANKEPGKDSIDAAEILIQFLQCSEIFLAEALFKLIDVFMKGEVLNLTMERVLNSFTRSFRMDPGNESVRQKFVEFLSNKPVPMRYRAYNLCADFEFDLTYELEIDLLEIQLKKNSSSYHSSQTQMLRYNFNHLCIVAGNIINLGLSPGKRPEDAIRLLQRALAFSPKDFCIKYNILVVESGEKGLYASLQDHDMNQFDRAVLEFNAKMLTVIKKDKIQAAIRGSGKAKS